MHAIDGPRRLATVLGSVHESIVEPGIHAPDGVRLRSLGPSFRAMAANYEDPCRGDRRGYGSPLCSASMPLSRQPTGRPSFRQIREPRTPVRKFPGGVQARDAVEGEGAARCFHCPKTLATRSSTICDTPVRPPLVTRFFCGPLRRSGHWSARVFQASSVLHLRGPASITLRPEAPIFSGTRLQPACCGPAPHWM